MKIKPKTESTIQHMQSLSGLRMACQEAVANDSEGLDPEPVFDRMESNHTEK